MANDARISTAFPSHPKTKKLRRRLGDSGPLACLYLFLWAAANRSDGDLSGMSDEDIELAVDWQGAAGEFVEAMASVGFLDGEEGSRVIHDWEDHNPWAAGAKARSEKARWAALCKQYGRREAARAMPEYAKRIADSMLESASSTKKSASSKLAAVPEGASGMLLAESSSAPSPSPSPSPSPIESTIVDLPPEPAEPDSEDGIPRCPVKKIVALYHEILPELPPVHELPEQSVKHLRQRWRSDPQRQSLDWWREFFQYVRECPFLMGEKTDFTADLLWLVRPTNFAKVLNGNYQERRA